MRYVIGLMLASLSMFTYAQRTPLACQDDRAAGLEWEQGKWSVRSFNTEKFILVKDGRSLTIDSVAKVLGINPVLIKCEVSLNGYVMCVDEVGGSLFFSHKSNKGGISLLLGAASENITKKDSVAVQVFTCTPF